MKNLIIILLCAVTFNVTAQEAEDNFGLSIGAMRMTDSRGILNASGNFEFVVTMKDKDPNVIPMISLNVGIQGSTPFYLTTGIGFSAQVSPEFLIRPFGQINTGIYITDWLAADFGYRHVFGNHILTWGVKFNFPSNPGYGCGYW